ncbi:hypothetical protein K438DRAFT_1954621 [Mycena galopus ATCC 62051]|nr:hypothetical protein K438DRAFT_1954621 [Mycena galopus ATCC 62051]
MRRINLPAIYLYTSSLLAFVAAILDLTQILLRGVLDTDNGLALNTVTGLVDTREVGFALAFGTRYLYLWAFVAQRPRYEPRPRTADDSEPSYHSASWERWSGPGFVLKYALLGSVISIPILQIIWRIATGFSAVYIAESTVQISVSVILIAKLMLNLYLSTVSPWWRPFLPYLVPIMALLISTGIGTGNLLFFKFSETTLGRFLQAVETYALILNVLIFTFYNVPAYVPPETVIADRRKQRSSFFTRINVDAKNDEPPFLQIGRAVTTPSSRESVVSRISSWINVRRPARQNSGEQPLWNAGDAELGIATQWVCVAQLARRPVSPRVVVEEKRSFEENRRTVSTKKESQVLVPPTPNTLEVTTPSTLNRPFTGVSFASYYGMASNSRLTMPNISPDDVRNTDSPVYGLNGIVAPGPAEPESPILSRRPPSLNSFDELLRQQTELDKSIAALRLFSPTTADQRTTSVSSGKSTSNRSEFSLSIFPDPPPVDRSSVLPETLPLGRARKPAFPLSRARRQSQVPHSAVSISGMMGDDGDLSTPMRFDSQATQYDVTSFIGDLTNPSNEPKAPVPAPAGILFSSGTASVSLRPLLLSSASPPITSLPPASGPSGAGGSATAQSPTYEYPVLKPLLLGGGGSSAPTQPRRVPAQGGLPGPRRPSRAGRDGRPMISGPRPQEEDQVDEAEAFEKPRRPPAF